MFILEKILNRSNSFKYYKNNSEKSSEVIDGLKKELENNEKLLNDKKNELIDLENFYADFQEFLIRQYTSPFINAPFDKIDKSNFLFMELIADHLESIAQNLDKKPLISVIMPVYNRKEIVMHSIESVLSQSYPNFELIIVDDASTDGTQDILGKIDHEKVKVICHDENRFCAGARNTSLKEAKGEFISYLDSDNLFDKRYLAAVVGAFSILPDADAVYTAQYKFETFNQDPSSIMFGVFNKPLLYNSNYIDINSFTHRRSVYESIGGFNERYEALEDWDLMMRMVNNDYKIYSIPVLLSLYFLHASNRTTHLISSNLLKEISEDNKKRILCRYPLDKKVSILIPVYMDDFNIEECIESILELNLDDAEIIISSNCPDMNLKRKLNDLKMNSIKIIESESNNGFSDALNQGLANVEKNSDVLLLNQNAILMPGSIEALQKYAYKLKDCGMVLSQEVLKSSEFITKHVPHANRLNCGCDISTSQLYKNIQHIPVFHNGEVIEMRFSTFFCTYIKNDVLNSYSNFNSDDCSSMKLFSEYVREVMGLKIYHVSDSYVINNSGKNYELTDYDNVSLDKLDYKWNF